MALPEEQSLIFTKESNIEFMLSAQRMANALELAGVKIIGFEESRDPKVMDGEVTLENSLSVQVGSDYACLCRVEDDDIDYILEMEELYDVALFAEEVVKFL
jgi:hypothetical protein